MPGNPATVADPTDLGDTVIDDMPWNDFPDDDIRHDNAYIPPAERPTAWARMAAGLAAEGRTIPHIADALCLDEATTRRLLTPVGGTP